MRIQNIVAVSLLSGICAGAAGNDEPAAGPPDSRPDRPPNIVFLFTDDHAIDAVSALDGTEIETPNIDRLARRGTTFTYAYNMGAWHGAVCVASRTMLNTGQFLWHAKARESRLKHDVDAGLLWAQRLQSAGYETYFTGKWHVKTNVDRVFDKTRVHHVRPGMPNQTDAGYDRPRAGQPDSWQPWDKDRGGYWKGGRHWSEVVADDAIEFLEQAAGRDAPFFLYAAFNAPHDPRQSPREFIERYPPEHLSIPKNFLPTYPFAAAMGCGPDLRDERLAPFPRTAHAVRVHRQEYYAIVAHLDQQIGRVLDAVDQLEAADETYIVFTSDHGLAVGHHGLMGKQSMFEHSVRVPLFVAGPRIPAGRRCTEPVYLQDVMPTTLELAGIEPPGDIEFHSLMPLIDGRRNESYYHAIYGAYKNRQRMVTQGGFKLILYPRVPKVLLFNLTADPEEIRDLSDDESTLGTQRRLFVALQSLQQTTGDTLDLEKTFPELVGK